MSFLSLGFGLLLEKFRARFAQPHASAHDDESQASKIDADGARERSPDADDESLRKANRLIGEHVPISFYH